MGRGGRIAVETLGCKLNYAESSAIAARFEKRAFERVELGDEPDLVIVNSCTVTENANRECRQIVRRALRSNPDAVVVVTGCYAQLKPQEIAAITGVSYVLGSVEKHRADEIVVDLEPRSEPSIQVGSLDRDVQFSGAATAPRDARTRSFLKIQDGCDYLCSFCTIPLARGASRSRDFAEVLTAAREIVASGYREIVLTGVNTGDYRGAKDERLVDVLALLHDVEGLERLRISSIEPNLLTDNIVRLAAASPIMVPHFHVPMQSGSDEVLASMRRRYRSSRYRDRILSLVDAIPDVAIGVDVIVGYPGETEQQFEETRLFLANLPISYLHVFPYSERENTDAAAMPGKVPVSERKDRTRILRDLSSRKSRLFAERYFGSSRPVLFESIDGEGMLVGYSDNYVRTVVPGTSHLVGTIGMVRLGGWHDERHVAGTSVAVDSDSEGDRVGGYPASAEIVSTTAPSG